jgi:hypothetical protein
MLIPCVLAPLVTDIAVAKKLESQVMFKSCSKAVQMHAASNMVVYKLKPGEQMFEKVRLLAHHCNVTTVLTNAYGS